MRLVFLAVVLALLACTHASDDTSFIDDIEADFEPEMEAENIDVDDVDGDVDEDEEDGEDEDEDDGDDDDIEEDDEEETAPAVSRKARRIAAEKAHVRHMYKALLHRYKSLRSEIARKVELVLAKKYAWLKLLYSRRRWYAMNRRYRNLVHKFKALPKKQFLVDAYRKYTQSEEYKLNESRKQYQLTCKRAHKYMHNLHEWVRMQKYKIHQLRLNLRHFLRTSGHSLTQEQREKLRLTLRERIREERSRLKAVDNYWKERIYTGDLPFPAQNPVKAESGVPTEIPTPHPLVHVSHVSNGATPPPLPASFRLFKEKRNWDQILDGPEDEHIPLSKLIGKVVVPSVPKSADEYSPKGWFAPLYNEAKRRRAHHQNRRLRHERKRMEIIEKGRKGLRNRKGAEFRKWKRAIRGSFRKAWHQK